MMETFFNKETKTIAQLDAFINYLTNNKISFLSSDTFPPMTPEIKAIYNAYSEATRAENVELAINLYNRLLELTPNFVAARYNMANAMKLVGNLNEALRQYSLAAKYNPHDPSIFIEMGSVYSMLGQQTEVIESNLHVLEMTSIDR